MKRTTWVVSVVALAVLVGAAFLLLRGNKDEIKWRTAKVDKGSITQRITATGTLNALIQVPVGTQVSGVVVSLTADFNSLVKKGQVIGQIDPTAWLNSLKDAEAAVQRARDTMLQAEVDYKRNQSLWKQKLLADADLDAKDLALKMARGSYESAKATLANAKTNLGYCTIKAPVDGVVVNRLVDVGQTVAASFATPNVFTIAQDLSKMKVQAAIDEADIGQVRVGQRAFFTVDSYPDKQFKGVVSEVQLNPTITNNVVTYNVIMEVTNEPRSAFVPAAEAEAPGAGRRAAPGAPAGAGLQGGRRAQPVPDLPAGPKASTLEYTTARYMPPGSPVYKGDLALFPGMTANCTIITNRKEATLRVPSSALRFNPAAFVTIEDKKPAAGAAPAAGLRAAGPNPSGTARGMVAKRDDRLWVLVDGKPKAVPCAAGVSDGSFTEVSGEAVTEGMVVLTGVDDFKKALNPSASPLGGGMRH
jgi:HlyD family secretion protein